MSEQAASPSLNQEIAALVSRAVEKSANMLPAATSPEIEQLAAALSLAQSEMFSPARNKYVSVTKKKGGTYDWRYASLDVINDMIREPLAHHGLSILHLLRPNSRGELFMATRLLHSSGQYMDSILPMTMAHGQISDETGPGWQSLGSALTFAKRYNLSALLSIAAQEDDDANIAEGNMVIDHDFPMDGNAALRVLHDRYSRLINAAANARDPAGVGEMLQRWQTGFRYWMRMRDQPDHAEHWARLLRLIPEALKRVHHDMIAASWLGSVQARTGGDVDAVRVLWESEEGRAERARMKGLNPIAYGMLFENLRLQAARVQRETEEFRVRERMSAEEAANRTFVLAEIESERSPFDPAAEPEPTSAEAEQAPAAETVINQHAVDGVLEPEESRRMVRDDAGDLTGEPYGPDDQVGLARELVEIYDYAENKQAVLEFNADGLAWARTNPDAAKILMEGIGPQAWGEPAQSSFATAGEAAKIDLPAEEQQLSLLPTRPGESWRVMLHKNGRGSPDVQGFIRSARISLERTGPGDLDDWVETNRATLESLPMSTQTSVMGLVVQRRMVLGVGEAA